MNKKLEEITKEYYQSKWDKPDYDFARFIAQAVEDEVVPEEKEMPKGYNKCCEFNDAIKQIKENFKKFI